MKLSAISRNRDAKEVEGDGCDDGMRCSVGAGREDATACCCARSNSRRQHKVRRRRKSATPRDA